MYPGHGFAAFLLFPPQNTILQRLHPETSQSILTTPSTHYYRGVSSMVRYWAKSYWRGILSIAALIFIPALLFCQIKPTIGLRQNTPKVHALTNATIVVAPGKVIQKGTL